MLLLSLFSSCCSLLFVLVSKPMITLRQMLSIKNNAVKAKQKIKDFFF